MKLKSFFSVVLVTFFTTFLFAQEGLPIYNTDYLSDNYYLIHPSMAGASRCDQIRLTARQQWFDVPDAPRLITLSANGRIRDTNSAIGGIVFSDKNGFHSQNAAYATYAHHLMFSRSTANLNMLSFGLSAGVIQYRLDETEFLGTESDAGVDGIVQNEANLNIDLGFSYHLKDLYLHATVKNLLGNAGINNDLEITSNIRRYLLSLGYVIGKDEWQYSYEPSVMLHLRDNTNESSFDINGKVYKKAPYGKLWGGLSYRRSLDGAEFFDGTNRVAQKSNQFSAIIGIDYSSFMFAYTYTHQINDVVFKPGFHQLSMGYNFNCRKIRFDCNCPAVN